MPTLRLPALSALAALPTPEQAVPAGPCVVPLLEMATPTDDSDLPHPPCPTAGYRQDEDGAGVTGLSGPRRYKGPRIALKTCSPA
jgi:hypothetical protein